MKKDFVYARDGGKCRYCGVELAYEDATVDHIKPKSRGGRAGKNSKNGALSCKPCNARKGNRLISPVFPAGNFNRKQWKKLGRPKVITT